MKRKSQAAKNKSSSDNEEKNLTDGISFTTDSVTSEEEKTSPVPEVKKRPLRAMEVKRKSGEKASAGEIKDEDADDMTASQPTTKKARTETTKAQKKNPTEKKQLVRCPNFTPDEDTLLLSLAPKHGSDKGRVDWKGLKIAFDAVRGRSEEELRKRFRALKNGK